MRPTEETKQGFSRGISSMTANTKFAPSNGQVTITGRTTSSQAWLNASCMAAGVEALDRREPRLLAQPQDDVPAVAVGERGQRLGDGRADWRFASP